MASKSEAAADNPARLTNIRPTSETTLLSQVETNVSDTLAQENPVNIERMETGSLRRVARVLEITIFVALLTLIALTAIPYGTNMPWSKALFECGVFALASLWIIEGLLSGSWLRPVHRLLMPALALVGYAFLQTLPIFASNIGAGIEGGLRSISFDPQSTRMVAINLLAYVLILGLLLRYTNTRRRLRALIYLVIGIAVLSALFGMLRQTTQHEAGFLLPGLMPGGGYGQFINYNHFVFLMEMALGLTLGLVVAGGVPREQKLVYLAPALLLWTALVLANSRGGILSMLGQMLLLGLMLSLKGPEGESSKTPTWLVRIARSFIVRTAIIIALLLTIVFSVLWLGGERLASRIEQSNEVTEAEVGGRDGAGRMKIWHSTWQVIKANPVFGVGFGAYWVAIDQFNNRSGNYKPYAAHNDYLDLLASGGLVGLALAAWFIFVVYKRARSQLRSADHFRRAACAGALVGIVGVAIHSLVEFGLQITVNAVIFVVLIAIGTAEIPDGRSKAEG